ncbi:C40 family peptidase [soil metagenome]
MAVSLSLSGAARADGPEQIAALQVRLVQLRQHLDQQYRLEVAKQDLAKKQRDLDTAKAALDHQRDAVAALTVQELQGSSGLNRLGSVFSSRGPEELLNRASAYSSTSEALQASIDRMAASKVVFASAAERSQDAVAEQEAAVKDGKRAQAGLDAAVAASEEAVVATQREREEVLAKLADAQKISLDEAEERQKKIDQDAETPPSQDPAPSDPEPADPADPTPAPPKPTTPKPTTPKPTTPAPDPIPAPPPVSSSKVAKAIAFAKAQIGEPYAYGAAGPSKWDCSGLTMKAWGAAGESLAHSSRYQYTQTTRVAMSGIKAGDLLFWTDSGPSGIYDVALYLGGGQMIHAPRTGQDVQIVPVSYWRTPDYATRIS